eukprot:scaffold5443_cov291-Pinguiococcus_pyrenoidosus.AAC.16
MPLMTPPVTTMYFGRRSCGILTISALNPKHERTASTLAPPRSIPWDGLWAKHAPKHAHATKKKPRESNMTTLDAFRRTALLALRRHPFMSKTLNAQDRGWRNAGRCVSLSVLGVTCQKETEAVNDLTCSVNDVLCSEWSLRRQQMQYALLSLQGGADLVRPLVTTSHK